MERVGKPLVKRKTTIWIKPGHECFYVLSGALRVTSDVKIMSSHVTGKKISKLNVTLFTAKFGLTNDSVRGSHIGGQGWHG